MGNVLLKATHMKCLYCSSNEVILFGKTKKQTPRYKCKKCSKTFTINKSNILHGSHRKREVWEQYVRSMLNGDTVRASAAICNITIRTSFIWRHKILDALSRKKELTPLKGNYNVGTMYFKSYKSKHQTESVYAGIAIAINDAGQSKSTLASINKINPELVDNALSPQIEQSKEVVTKQERIAEKLILHNQLKLRSFSETKHKFKKIEQHKIDIYEFTKRFKGLSSKYLSNYLTWFDLRNEIKSDDLINTIVDITFNEKFEDVTKRPEVPEIAQTP